MCRGKSKCMACARASKRIGAMKTSRMKGKLENRKVSVSFYQLLWVLAGGLANYALVNPMLNKVIEQIPESAMSVLGPYRGQILTALKGGGAAFMAYAAKLPTEARLALMGVATASGIELGGQLLSDKMVALNGTGDLYIQGIGNTDILNLPIGSQDQLAGVETDSIAVFGNEGLKESSMAMFGTGDLYASDGEVMPSL